MSIYMHELIRILENIIWQHLTCEVVQWDLYKVVPFVTIAGPSCISPYKTTSISSHLSLAAKKTQVCLESIFGNLGINKNCQFWQIVCQQKLLSLSIGT